MHPAPSTRLGPVMQRLKDSTSDLHTRAESSEFQRLLIKGEVSRTQYTQWLGQMLLVHAALERHMRALLASRPALSPVVRNDLFQEANLRADLAFLGLDESQILATPAAARIIDLMETAGEKDPISILGFYYVLEGSKNGSKYIARAVRRGLDIEPGAGDRYLDPHGAEQSALWASFKQAMGELEFTEPQIESMIDAACRMFEAAEGIGADLLARS